MLCVCNDAFFLQKKKCFYFENLIYKWINQYENLKWEWSYFLDNVLVKVRVVFLSDCPLIFSLLKHRDVGAF